jgi:urease accessory protein UreH
MTPVLDRRATERVGRTARLELVFAVHGGRTVLAHSYAEPPFRTGRCFAEGNGLHMIMTTSAPGMFGGDVLEQVIVVEEGASVRLTSQSAPQLHASAGGATTVVRSSYRVAERARMSCHWDALIPFADASLDQRIELQLAASSRMYWSDAMMSGREACGERWLFSSIAHQLRITQAGELTYLERYQMAPREGDLSAPWIAADAAFFGTTVMADPHGLAPREAEGLHTMLNGIDGVRAAADALSESTLVVRLMGSCAVPFHGARAMVRGVVASR